MSHLEERRRNFKSLSHSRQRSSINAINPHQYTEVQEADISRDNDNSAIQRRSMTPLARHNPRSQTPTIPQRNGEGVCTNCINELLGRLHNHPKDTSKPSPNLFDLQFKLNEYQQSRISSSIYKRMSLAEKAAGALPKTNEKQRFVSFIEEEPFTLNESTPNLAQRKVIEKYNLKEDTFNKTPVKPRYENRKVTDYYERVIASTSQNQAIIVNNSNKYTNPYLPSIKQYTSVLVDQIKLKKNKQEKEKQLDHELEKKVYEVNKLKHEEETAKRREFSQKLRRDFILNNSRLISLKQKKDRFDRLNDISTELKRTEEMKEENRRLKDRETVAKTAQRKQLRLSLDSQIRNKMSTKELEKRNESQDDYINVYREPMKKEELCACDHCDRKYSRRFICPKEEYQRLLTQQK